MWNCQSLCNFDRYCPVALYGASAYSIGVPAYVNYLDKGLDVWTRSWHSLQHCFFIINILFVHWQPVTFLLKSNHRQLPWNPCSHLLSEHLAPWQRLCLQALHLAVKMLLSASKRLLCLKGTNQSFSYFNEPPGDLVNMQILIQWVWGGACYAEFPTSSQVRLMLEI